MAAQQRALSGAPLASTHRAPARPATPRASPGSLPRQRFQARASAGLTSKPHARPAEQFFAADRRPIVLFDGVCNLCNGGVDTALRFDRNASLRFAALQSDAGRQLLRRSRRAPDDISSIVLVEPEGSYIKSEAVLRIARRLQVPFPMLAQLGFPFPLPFRDTVYDAVANNRYLVFGQKDTCRLLTQAERDRFLQ